jgi:hypothetical protein
MLEFRDKGTSGTQFDALSGGVIVASVYKTAPSVIAEQVWHWTFRMSAGPPGFQPHGTAPTFDEAQTAVESQWACWLTTAGLRRDGA